MTRVSKALAESMLAKSKAISAHESFEAHAPSPILSRRFARARKPNPGGQAVSKLEREYGNFLEHQKRLGSIVGYKHQPLKLRLADKTYYNPDYSVHRNDDVIELVEVKGLWEDMSRVKVKVCAEQFPEFLFVAVTRPKKNEEWKREEF
jgi:hypothetical protein